MIMVLKNLMTKISLEIGSLLARQKLLEIYSEISQKEFFKEGKAKYEKYEKERIRYENLVNESIKIIKTNLEKDDLVKELTLLSLDLSHQIYAGKPF